MSLSKPNRSLLNPKFEGYKLSPLDQEEVVSRYSLEHQPSQTNVSGRSHVSFQEVQSRISHNHLTVCEESERAVYVDGDLRLISVDLDQATLAPSFQIIYELPKQLQSTTVDAPQREYPSSAFLDASTLFVSDGFGYLYVLQVSRSEPAALVGIYDLQIPPPYGSLHGAVPFRIHSAVLASPDADTAVVLLSSKHYPATPATSGNSRDREKSPVEFDVWAVRFASPVQQTADVVQSLDILWHRRGADVPLYTFYDATRLAFLLVGGSSYRMLGVPGTAGYVPTADELAPIPRAGENLDSTGSTTPAQPPPPPSYSWTQSDDSVTVAIPLPSTVTTDDIRVTFSPTTITVIVRDSPATVLATNSPTMLPKWTLKKLWDGIHPDTSMWTWDRAPERGSSYGMLSLHLDKTHEGTRWSQVFARAGTGPSSAQRDVEDIEVPETLDPSELFAIREALEKYTAALQDGSDASGLGLGQGVPRLARGEVDDEVDLAVGRGTEATWVRADGGAPSWSAGARAQVLSTPFPGQGRQCAELVVKNDLDGLLYTVPEARLPDDTPEWTHTSTYPALAFVLASKRDTRFTHHVGSAAVLAFESGSGDLGGNAYIYRGASRGEKWAQQAVIKVGGGLAGSLLGLGMVGARAGRQFILGLCEKELVILHGAV